ncbi:MAG: 4Fe-4S binding protein [Bilophila sp.]
MFMLKNVVRNFLKRPATRKYPLVKRDPFAASRGRLINHVDTCIFCRMCSTRCPSQCISTDPKEAFWGYDPFSCVYCGICVEVCPTKSLFMLNTHRAPVPTKFVVYHKGIARVSRPKLSSMPKVAPGEKHAETPPPSVIAATELPVEEPKPKAPTPRATPAPKPRSKKK